MYYTWKDLVADANYEAHVECRWPGGNVTSMVMRLARIADEAEDDILEYMSACSSRCYSYRVKLGGKGPGTKVKTFFLLCLSVRWGIDLSKMIVFVGERGDTDYKDLLVGIHKTVILKGSVEYASKTLLRSEDSFKREDVVPQDTHSIALPEGYDNPDISTTLETLEII
ncbi:unnamed protein product [Ilex paraguariensis]|uniref:Uncharacterized protein n=1 Tax=Ilex paraguariensis TaxID=185542 RepID=A0ABC8RCH2_9AQUA